MVLTLKMMKHSGCNFHWAGTNTSKKTWNVAPCSLESRIRIWLLKSLPFKGNRFRGVIRDVPLQVAQQAQQALHEGRPHAGRSCRGYWQGETICIYCILTLKSRVADPHGSALFMWAGSGSAFERKAGWGLALKSCWSWLKVDAHNWGLMALNEVMEAINGALEGVKTSSRRFLLSWWGAGSGSAYKWKAGSGSSLQHCGSATLLELSTVLDSYTLRDVLKKIARID